MNQWADFEFHNIYRKFDSMEGMNLFFWEKKKSADTFIELFFCKKNTS